MLTFIYFSELETASFEPNLSQAVAKNSVKALSMFCVKCENLVNCIHIHILSKKERKNLFLYVIASVK